MSMSNHLTQKQKLIKLVQVELRKLFSKTQVMIVSKLLYMDRVMQRKDFDTGWVGVKNKKRRASFKFDGMKTFIQKLSFRSRGLGIKPTEFNWFPTNFG